MQYNAEMGGSILTSAGKPALNSEANIKSLDRLPRPVSEGRASRRRGL